MMAGAVTLSLADVYYPTMLLGRAGAAGLAVAGAAGSAVWAGGRWGMDQLQKWSSMHTGGGGGPADGFGGRNGSPPAPPGGGPSGPSSSPAAGPAVASPVTLRSNPSRIEPASGQGQADARTPAAPANTRQGKNREGNAQIPTPPNTPMPL